MKQCILIAMYYLGRHRNPLLVITLSLQDASLHWIVNDGASQWSIIFTDRSCATPEEVVSVIWSSLEINTVIFLDYRRYGRLCSGWFYNNMEILEAGLKFGLKSILSIHNTITPKYSYKGFRNEIFFTSVIYSAISIFNPEKIIES